MLVGIEEVLARLRDRGPLATAEIARLFGLNPVDARLLMLHAHVRGQVRRNDWGEWAITERGREAIAAIAFQQAEDSRRMTRSREALVRTARGIGSQRGVALVACLASSAVVAAVAGAFAGTAVHPTAASPYRYAQQPVTGPRPVRGRAARHRRHLVVVAEHRYGKHIAIAGVRADRFARPGSRTPIFNPFARHSLPAGRASAVRPNVRMEAVRRARSRCVPSPRSTAVRSTSGKQARCSSRGPGAGKRGGATGVAPAR